jgi:hypothetical protein
MAVVMVVLWLVLGFFPSLRSDELIFSSIIVFVFAVAGRVLVGLEVLCLFPGNVLIHKKTWNLTFVNEHMDAWKSDYAGWVVTNRCKWRAWASGSVSPVTSNPKVRTIAYDVRLVADLASEEDFQKWFHFLTTVHHVTVVDFSDIHSSIQRMLKFELYEFQNAHSQEIAEFYNPLDPAQQQKFHDLVFRFLQERLPGLSFQTEKITFNLAA